MPSQHLNRARVYRPDDELYERAQAAVSGVGSNMNAHVIEFLRWLVGDTDVLPERPSAPTPRPVPPPQRARSRRSAG